MEWLEKKLVIPDSYVNFALAANGATARASRCTDGFMPEGAINGDRTLYKWGRGNGWQAPSPVWHPNWWGEWLEITFEAMKTIDTIIVFTFPQFVKGRQWRGANNFQVQYLDSCKEWVTLDTISGNVEDYCVLRFSEVDAYSVRILVTRNHYPEEKGFEAPIAAIDESPRIVEVEAYRLQDTEIIKEIKRTREIEKGTKGSAAVFSDDSFHESCSSPEKIASVLRRAGYGVTLLSADELCVSELFNAKNFSVFIHPYGKYVPLGINLFDFLQGGGHMITLGGRAFTAVKQKAEDGWRDLEMDPEITASKGRYNDSILPYREQLGIFSIPFSKLKYAEAASLSCSQHATGRKVELEGPLEGWMACGMTGELLPIDESAVYTAENRLHKLNHISRSGINANKCDEQSLWGMDENYPPLFQHPCARWVPLLSCYDKYGRDRGAAGALLMHYEGMYRGSHWAFFGIEGIDILENKGMDEALADIADYLHKGLCLHSLEPEYSCYYQGEKVNISVIIDNCGRKDSLMEVRLSVIPEAAGATEKFIISESFPLQPGQWRRLEAAWEPGGFGHDLYKIKAELIADGQVYDVIESGFVVWNEDIISGGPKVQFKDNYFHFDGVPRYVVGARDSGFHLPGQPDENPLGWDRQYRMMRDYGMQVTSPVHLDWLIPGLGWGEMDCRGPIPETMLRRIDAQVQLAQKHKLIYAPNLFFAYENQAIKDIEKSEAVCRSIGKRYAKVPGIMFYLLDDCLKHTPDIFNKWVKACVDALNSTGREYMVTVEFGFRQEWPDTFRHGSKHLTFNSGSCFQRTVSDPVYERLVDMRPAGKSFTHGEFVRRIPAGTLEDFHGYLAPVHLNFGMGYAMSMNWKWRTGYHAIWPSDVVFPGDWVPKDHLYAFRNEALFLRRFKPVYRPAALLVVMPSGIWLRNTEAVTRYLVAFLRRLIEMKVDFACIDDTDLELLPESTAALIYPIPMEMSDKIYNQIKNYVMGGGKLLLTGDISGTGSCGAYEADRPERLEELCGVVRKGFAHAPWSKGHSLFTERFLPEIHACADTSCIKTHDYASRPWIEIECKRAKPMISGEAGQPVATRASYGNGDVWFTPDMGAELPRELLAEFLKAAGIERNQVIPDIPSLHCFKSTTATGFVHSLISFPWDQGKRSVELAIAAGTISMILKNHVLGVVHVDKYGAVNAVETQGKVTINGAELMDTDSHAMIMSLDEKDIRKSCVLAVYPITEGNISLKNEVLDTAEIGEFVNGCWHAYETLKTQWDNGRFSLDIRGLRVTAWILAFNGNEREKAIAFAESAL